MFLRPLPSHYELRRLGTVEYNRSGPIHAPWQWPVDAFYRPLPRCSTRVPALLNGQHQTIWKYSFWNHLDTHIEEDSGRAIPLPPDLLHAARVSLYEERSLGISDHTFQEWRNEHVVAPDAPGPDDYVPLQ
jgi:hypothetical protein